MSDIISELQGQLAELAQFKAEAAEQFASA